MSLFALKSSTALSPQGVPAFDFLQGPERQKAASAALGERAWAVGAGNEKLDFSDLAKIAQELEKRGLETPPLDKKHPSPVNQKAFHDYLRRLGDEAKTDLAAQLKELRDEAKQEKDYLLTAFSVFSRRDPLAKVMDDVAAFDKYVRRNGLVFDEETQKLAPNGPKQGAWNRVKDMRFLIAAAGGTLLGAAGLNLTDNNILPPLMTEGFGKAMGTFFGPMLSNLAAPFIALNVFKAFSENRMIKAAPTLARFAATTTLALGVTAATMYGLQPVLSQIDLSQVPGLPDDSSKGGFNPMNYILQGIGAMTLAASGYKRAKSSLSGQLNSVAPPEGSWKDVKQVAAEVWRDHSLKSAASHARPFIRAVGRAAAHDLAGAYNAYDKAMNKIARPVAPVIMALGKAGETGTKVINRAFPTFINWLGPPAVAALTSRSMSSNGTGLGAFGTFYAVMAANLALSALVMTGLMYASGLRREGFKQVFSAMKDGFAISSSGAVMPKEREVLKNIGVSEGTRETSVPLGGVFNMFGTTSYLFAATLAGQMIFGHTPSFSQFVGQAAAVFGIAMGAPGIPASSIAFLSPSLHKTSLSPEQIGKVYAMIMPADRIFDMKQTAINVMGDLFAPIHIDRKLVAAKSGAKSVVAVFKEKTAKILHRQPKPPKQQPPAAKGPQI